MDYNYNLETVTERMHQLLLVLNYDRFNGRNHFNFYDRLQICKERSALQSIKNFLFKEIDKNEIKSFQVPTDVENKIKRIQIFIIQEGYQQRVGNEEIN